MKKEFKTKTIITYEEYKKKLKLFSLLYLKKMIIISIVIFAFCFSEFFPPDPASVPEYFEIAIFLILCAALILKIFDLIFRKVNYKKYIKRYSNDIDFYILSFFKEYLKKENNNESIKIKYNNIKKIKETENNFYIFLNNKKEIIVIKENCSSELIEFIKNISNNKGLNIKYLKNINEFINPETPKYKKIKSFLLVLFILSILSIWIGLGIVSLLMNKYGTTNLMFTSYMWGMLLPLPIPIMSIILGFIYNKKGIKCIKNIIGGFTIVIFLILFGSFSITFDFERNYNEVYSYEKIIGTNLPSQGKYLKIKWDTSYLINHITHYIKFTDFEETKTFTNDINNNNNWLTQDQINTNLGTLIPTSLVCKSQHKCYYSVYIKELNEYNEYLTETGTYHIYAMMFDYNSTFIQIEDYILYYKK